MKLITLTTSASRLAMLETASQQLGQMEHGQRCPRVRMLRAGLADMAVRAPSLKAQQDDLGSQRDSSLAGRGSDGSRGLQPTVVGTKRARRGATFDSNLLQLPSSVADATRASVAPSLTMKTNHPFHSTRFHWATALLAGSAPVALTMNRTESTRHPENALHSRVQHLCWRFLLALGVWVISLGWNAPANGAPIFQTLKSFNDSAEGANPYGALIQGSDGALYGTTLWGGFSDFGTVFKLNADGSGYTVLRNFSGDDGGNPWAPLLQGINGAIYGTTSIGGGRNGGTVFKLNVDGSGYTILREFVLSYRDGDIFVDGHTPHAGLLQASDGALYGTTQSGGNWGVGTVFKMDLDGGGYSVLRDFEDAGFFQGGIPAIREPEAGLIQGIDGALYGTAAAGAGAIGGVFKLNLDGTGFTVLKGFRDISEGWGPYARLLQASNGALYGTTYQSFGSAAGVIFKLNVDGSGFSVIHAFNFGAGDGTYPLGHLIQGRDGALYGTAEGGGSSDLGTVFKINLDGSGYMVLHEFSGTDGAYPKSGLVQGTDGALYGTTWEGGEQNFGTIFRIILPSVITSLNPNVITGGNPDFTLTVNGSGFVSGAVVHWNGAARPTTFLSDSQLLAAIPASDLAGGAEITTVMVTVLNPIGVLSNPQSFAITAPNVAAAQTTAVQPSETATVSTAPMAAGEVGVTATVNNSGGDPVSVTVANYSSNPSGTAFSAGGGFTDVQITGADLADTASVNFYYPSTIDSATEVALTLVYFNVNTSGWDPVRSTGNTPPVKNTSNNLDGTISGGRFTVVFDSTSTPKIIELSGTIFAAADITPNITLVSTPANPTPVQSSVPVSISYSAAGNPSAHTVALDWGDSSSSGITPVISGIVNTSHMYGTPGVYTITVTLNDGVYPPVQALSSYVVIYDPNGGFVTGGGWINSPPGAYAANPSATGKANFGFVSKYQKGATVPTGQTEFQFKAGDLNFKSTSYDWLVITVAKAKYKGSGSINGAGAYGFMLTATDGQASGGDGTDRFRIKIWDKSAGDAVVYDNKSGAADEAYDAQEIGGGSIVIHKQ